MVGWHIPEKEFACLSTLFGVNLISNNPVFNLRQKVNFYSYPHTVIKMGTATPNKSLKCVGQNPNKFL